MIYLNYFELGSSICRNVYKENNFSKDHLENGVALAVEVLDGAQGGERKPCQIGGVGLSEC